MWVFLYYIRHDQAEKDILTTEEFCEKHQDKDSNPDYPQEVSTKQCDKMAGGRGGGVIDIEIFFYSMILLCF